MARHCSRDTTGHVRDHKWLPLACQAPAPGSSVRLKPAVSGRHSCQTAHHYLGSSPHPSLWRLFPSRMRCWCCLNKCLVLRRAPSLRLYPASEWVLRLTQPAKWRFKRLGDQLRPVIPTLKIVFKGHCALHYIGIHFVALKCHCVDLALTRQIVTSCYCNSCHDFDIWGACQGWLPFVVFSVFIFSCFMFSTPFFSLFDLSPTCARSHDHTAVPRFSNLSLELSALALEKT